MDQSRTYITPDFLTRNVSERAGFAEHCICSPDFGLLQLEVETERIFMIGLEEVQKIFLQSLEQFEN